MFDKKVFLLFEFKISINKIRIIKEKIFKYYDIIDILDFNEVVFLDVEDFIVIFRCLKLI